MIFLAKIVELPAIYREGIMGIRASLSNYSNVFLFHAIPRSSEMSSATLMSLIIVDRGNYPIPLQRHTGGSKDGTRIGLYSYEIGLSPVMTVACYLIKHIKYII